MNTIYDAFLPIAIRLATITGENIPRDYIHNDEYGEIVRKVEVNANRFPLPDRLKVMDEYYWSITQLLEKMYAELPKEVIDIKRPVNPFVDWDNNLPERKPFPHEVFFLEELEYYQAWLSIKVTDLKAHKSIATPIEPKSQINLPDNFTIKDLNKHFNGSLSPLQSVLLLHFLKEEKIIPEYSQSSIAKLGEALLGRHEKTTVKFSREIHSHLKDKNELNKLKSIFENIIKNINSHL